MLAEKEHSGLDSDESTLSSHYGQNVRLSRDYRTAWRNKSYNFGLVFSSFSLPDSVLFQFEILETVDWSGSLKVGVTGLTPEVACNTDKACQLKDHSYILGSSDGVSCLYVGGMEVMSIPQIVDIASLEVGSIIGVLINISRTILHFFVDQTHLQIELPQAFKLPKQRHVVIDIYGKCSKIQLHPLRYIKETELLSPTYKLKIPLEAFGSKLHTHSVSSKKIVMKNKECHVTNLTTTHQVLQTSYDVSSSSVVSRRSLSSVNIHNGKTVDHQRCSKACDYQILCENFLRSLNLSESYFEKQYNKCFCNSCSTSRKDPAVKFHGEPPSKYSVPLGWMQFGLKLDLFASQAQNHSMFLKLHKAYHGTSVENVKSILDTGRLLLPGTHTQGHGCVTRPEGHFNEIWKPAGFDPNQIFMSPSIKYCSQYEVFSKRYSYNDPTTNVTYCVKVCFKLLVKPGSYMVSRQTVVSDHSIIIDDQFSNDQLEWSTKRYKNVYLHSLMVQILSN